MENVMFRSEFLPRQLMASTGVSRRSFTAADPRQEFVQREGRRRVRSPNQTLEGTQKDASRTAEGAF
jgi:hypothetical protein